MAVREPIEFNKQEGIVRRYLVDDLSLECSSDEYMHTRNLAIKSLALWPIGVPLSYVALLWMSRDAHNARFATPLRRMTDFLWGDYKPASFFWEPLEMCRKLALTGERACPHILFARFSPLLSKRPLSK